MRLIDRVRGARYLLDQTYPGASNAVVVLQQSYGKSDSEPILPSFQSFASEGFSGSGPVFSVIRARLDLFTEAEFKFRDLATKKLFGTQALGILEQPFPGGGTGELLARMELDASLAGNFFCRVDREQERLWRWRPDWVDIVRVPTTGDEHEVAGYAYWPEGRDSGRPAEFWPVDDVIHWSPIPDPLAWFRGMSWLTPVVREINGDIAMTAYKRSFFDNNATPNIVIKYASKLEKGAIEQLTTRWNARYGGPDGWKTAILDQGADLQVVGSTFEQMDFSAVQGAGETRIASAGGVPPTIAGLKEGLSAATQSDYAMAMRHFSDKMRPTWRSACQALAKAVDVPTGARLWYDTTDIAALREGEKERADTMAVQASAASTLLMAGYTPDSIIAAISASDVTLLQHSGMTSVQLYPPGTTPPTAPTP